MTLVAQLTDVHLLDRPASGRNTLASGRIAFLSGYRPLSAEKRIERARKALAECRAAKPDHVIVTGDLTEDASKEQWQIAAELLHESGLDPQQITFVPGNHDMYRGRAAIDEAFAGPLAAFRRGVSGEAIDLGDARLVPLDTTIEQHWVRAAARLGALALERLEALAADLRPMLVATHHPPLGHALPGLAWFQELVDQPAMEAFVARHRHVFVAHGHVHRHREHVIADEPGPRVFSAAAVVEHPAPVRFYDVDRKGVRVRR